jgi:L-fuconolactonase
MPNFPIIDTHVHLYDVERFHYAWLESVPPINRTCLIRDFDRARKGVEVEKFVFAEVAVSDNAHLQEAEFIQGLANDDVRLAGMITHAPLEKGELVRADLEVLHRLKSTRGVRRLIETEQNPSFCISDSFIAGVRMLPAYGFTFDICIKHWAMVYAIELVKRCPDVTFVLDHIGKPDISNGIMEPWKRQITELATLPNVVCKISGVITEANHASWSKVDIEPYIAHVIEQFGFDRIMFGSDWSVAELTHSYAQFVEILDELLVSVSEYDQRKFYRENAMRIYRL